MSINGVLLWIQSKNSYYRPVHLKAEGIAVNWGKGMPNTRKLVTKLESETSELTFQWGQLQQLQIFFPDAWYLKLDWLALKWTTDCHRVCVRTYVNISFSMAFFFVPRSSGSLSWLLRWLFMEAKHLLNDSFIQHFEGHPDRKPNGMTKLAQ